MSSSVVVVVTFGGEHHLVNKILLVHTFLVKRDELERSLVKLLNQVQICFHFLAFVLFSELFVLFHISILRHQALSQLIQKEPVVGFSASELLPVGFAHVCQILLMRLLNDLLVGVHGLSPEDSAPWLQVLVVIEFLFKILLCLAASRTKIAHQIKLVALLNIIYRKLNFSLSIEDLLSTRDVSKLFVISLASILLLLLQLIEEFLILFYFGNQLQIFMQLTR